MYTFSIIACGFCVDQYINNLMPFWYYWILLFSIWTLIIGPILYFKLNMAENHEKHPSKYFFLYLLFVVGISILSIGQLAVTIILPFILLFFSWIFSTIYSMKSGNKAWKLSVKILFAAIIIAVPISFYQRIPSYQDPSAERIKMVGVIREKFNEFKKNRPELDNVKINISYTARGKIIVEGVDQHGPLHDELLAWFKKNDNNNSPIFSVNSQ